MSRGLRSAATSLNDGARGAFIERLALLGDGENGAVAGQRHAERFAQAVHRVGREHAGAGTAGRDRRSARASCKSAAVILPACSSPTPLNTEIRSDFCAAGRRCAGQVAVRRLLRDAGRHRAAADEDGRDVEAHRGHQHAGHDLVAVRDADHAVEAMRADHGLHAIGDQFARGQRILHAAVAHRDAVIHADGVEDERARRRPRGPGV